MLIAICLYNLPYLLMFQRAGMRQELKNNVIILKHTTGLYALCQGYLISIRKQKVRVRVYMRNSKNKSDREREKR